MQDRQIAKFFQTRGFLDMGLISFEKPRLQVKLSQVLERGSIPQKYYLSAKACAGILRRAEKRGKKLPALLEQALRTVAIGTTQQTPTPLSTNPSIPGGVGQSNQELFSQRGAYLVPGDDSLICMAHGQAGAEIRSDGSPSLTCNHEAPIIAYPLQEIGKRTGVSTSDPRCGVGIGAENDPMYTLQSGAQHGVALCQYGEVAGTINTNSNASGRNTPLTYYGLTVRRLMPIECELLQGMPRNHTAIPGAADGPRYKAIGNSKAVPVVRWIGRRLQGVLDALL